MFQIESMFCIHGAQYWREIKSSEAQVGIVCSKMTPIA